MLDLNMVTYPYAAGLVGPDGHLREELVEKYGFIERILILHRIKILSQFRGCSLGLWATYRMLDAFATGAMLPVLMPHPLQFSPDTNGDGAAYAFDAFTANRPEAFMKVCSYWRRIGFEKIWGEGDEELWALDPIRVQPNREIVLSNRLKRL